MFWPLDPPPMSWPLDPPYLRRLILLPLPGGGPHEIPAEVVEAAQRALAQDGDPEEWEMPGPDPGRVWTLALVAKKFIGLSVYVIGYGESKRRMYVIDYGDSELVETAAPTLAAAQSSVQGGMPPGDARGLKRKRSQGVAC